MIIGICGFIGTGKDTFADYLVTWHDFRRESFANSLKDAVASVFGWPRDLLEGRTQHSRAWREQVDPWWAERLAIPTLTPRWILQYWGTDVCRKTFHDDIWIASLENKLRNNQDNIVISDCRFPNEISAIKKAGGLVIRIVRGPDPDWFDAATSVNQGPTGNMNWAISKARLEKLGIHASETAWIGTKFDAVIDNNADLAHLYTQINDLLQDHQASTANHF